MPQPSRQRVKAAPAPAPAPPSVDRAAHRPGQRLELETRRRFERPLAPTTARGGLLLGHELAHVLRRRRSDPLENEADRLSRSALTDRAPAPRCTCAGGGECASCRARRLQPSAPPTTQRPATLPPSVHRALSRPGRPLQATARAQWEERFGVNLESVRIHDDREAAASARSVSARAYTVGEHVVFGAGRYRPSASAGERLLGHELVHVLQQRDAAGGLVTGRTRPRLQRAPDDDEEEVSAAKVAEARSVLAITTDPSYDPDQLSEAALVRHYLILKWAAQHFPDPYQRTWAKAVLQSLQGERDRRLGKSGSFPRTTALSSKTLPKPEQFPPGKTDFDADELELYGARLALPEAAPTIPTPPAVVAGVAPFTAPTAPVAPPSAPLPEPVPTTRPPLLGWSKPPPTVPSAPVEPGPVPGEQPAPIISPGVAGALVAATIFFASPDLGTGSDITQDTDEQRRRRRRGCFAPSLGFHEPVPQGWGYLAESAIEGDYCSEFGCSDADWFDNNSGYSMVAFLVENNPSVLGQWAAARLLSQARDLRRPDILSHKRNRKEYYEIKPDSNSGRAAGREKLLEISSFMDGNRLPYHPGTEYQPAMIPLPAATVGPIIGRPEGYDYLLVRLLQPGLLVYKICDLKLLNQ